MEWWQRKRKQRGSTGARQRFSPGHPWDTLTWSSRRREPVRPWPPGLARTCLFRAGFLAVLFPSCAIVPTAWAAEYANSALATSLGMAPELVDEMSLLFRLPQRAGLTSSRLFALFNREYYYSPFEQFPTVVSSFGVVAQTHGNSFFLFAQPSSFLGNRTFLQAGWGGTWSIWRAGIAVRGGRTESESSDSRVYHDGRTYGSESSSRFSLWEGSVGIGVGGEEGAALDAALDVRRPEQEAHALSMQPDTSFSWLESPSDVFYEVVGRLRLPLSSNAALVAVGSWGLMETDLENAVTRQDSLVRHTTAQRLERWSGGALVSFATARIDWLGLSFYWRHEEVPSSVSATSINGDRAEQIVLSVALRQRVWRELQAQGGVHLLRGKTGSVNRGFNSSYDYTYEDEQETFAGSFTWGLSGTWRRFDGRVALDQRLDLGNLFVALDAVMRF